MVYPSRRDYQPYSRKKKAKTEGVPQFITPKMNSSLLKTMQKNITRDVINVVLMTTLKNLGDQCGVRLPQSSLDGEDLRFED